MKLNVAQLMKSPVGTTREYDLEETFGEIEDQRLTRPVKIRLHLTRINDGLLARGDVATALDAPCSRCTEPAEQALRFHFDEQFRPTIDIATGHPLKEDDKDVADPVYTVDSNHQMDLDEVIREGIVLEAPMHPLCRPDCQGLCPRCGANLNQGVCECDADAPSGPMAAILKDLAPLLTENRR
ncbi:MAG: YceD family protein [Chloroflexota bacterium]